jgi:hypothetical protein
MARVIGDERIGAGVRLQLAAVRAVADELEHAFGGDSSQVPSSLAQQLAEELETLGEGSLWRRPPMKIATSLPSW